MHGEVGGEAGPCAGIPNVQRATWGRGIYAEVRCSKQQFHGQQQQFQRTRTTVFRRQFRQMEAIIAQRTPFGRHVAISHTEGTTQLCHPWTTNCGEGKGPRDCVHWLFIWFGACPSNPVTAACSLSFEFQVPHCHIIVPPESKHTRHGRLLAPHHDVPHILTL